MNAKIIWVLAAAFSATSCVMGTQPAGPMQHESRSIPRGASESARVDLRMGGGELRVNGGAPDLVSADFDYNVPSWKPDIRSSTAAGRTDVTIQQASGQSGGGKNQWDLRLNNDVPTDLRVRLGGGEAHLNLGSVPLRSVEVDIGAGELDLDLRGMPKQSYDVRVRGGAGEATVHLPRNAGVYAKAEGGLGEIKVSGLRKEGQHWISEDYDRAKVQIHLDIKGGVGQINLLVE
ncbi:MAG: hypothetical protein C5B51_01290 [Terriglobia bacterium]|nr:MAG: hypothetical protein C5B51_01290 [Terriglobia bacterium]